MWTVVSMIAGHASASMCGVTSACSFCSLSCMFPYAGRPGQFLATVRQGQGVGVRACVRACVLAHVSVLAVLLLAIPSELMR